MLTARMPRGSITAPFTIAQYWEKYDACVQGLLDNGQAAALKQALRDFHTLTLASDMSRCFAVNLQAS
jgi:hypothetical protein